MTTDEYNGWTNRETWALNLWLSNDQGLYEMTRERVADAIAAFYLDNDADAEFPAWRAGAAVATLWDELTDEDGEFAPLSPEIRMAVREVGSEWRVNWDEIGAAWMPEDES